MQERFCDTNVITEHSEEIFKKFDRIYLSGYVLHELDKHKMSDSPEKKYQARRAGRDIEKYKDKIEYVIKEGSFALPLSFDNSNMDNKIISILKDLYTYNKDVIGLSNDLLFREKCKLLGIPCEKFDGNESSDEIYKGYKTLTGGTYFINELFENVTKGINEYNFSLNEYLILFNSDTGKISEHRYNGSKFVDLKLPDSKIIKGKNSLQRCSLDLLNNKDISIVSINGTVGSGKTFLCTRMGLHHVIDKGNASKVLAVREALGEGKEVGFLKGTFEEKTAMFFKPIQHSLKNGEIELKYLVDQNILESNIPFYLKGTTYSETIIVCDEASDMTKKQLKLIGTRLGEESRIFFAGDYKQSSVDATQGNALVQMCNELKGNKDFGCIYLDDDVRSPASKIFANLFEN